MAQAYICFTDIRVGSIYSPNAEQESKYVYFRNYSWKMTMLFLLPCSDFSSWLVQINLLILYIMMVLYIWPWIICELNWSLRFSMTGEVAFSNRHQILLGLCNWFQLCIYWNFISMWGAVQTTREEEKTLEFSHQLCNVCFWTGLLCSNWLCQTEELDEAQTNCGLLI